jgi:hypothetical protein
MTWTDQQLAEMERQYDRVGYVKGERWPAPPDHLSPDDLLALFRTLPDGAGRAGYMKALAALK